jgi:PAS domain S-box-containing protein
VGRTDRGKIRRDAAMTDWIKTAARWLNDSAPQGILITDTELNIRGWNRWLEIHSHRPATEMLGRNLLDVYPELVERRIVRYYQGALAGQVQVLSTRFHRYLLPLPTDLNHGLEAMLQRVHIAPLVEDDRVIGTLTEIADVTERVLRERELWNREQWLHTMLQSIGDAVMGTDDQGAVALMNPVAEELTAWTEGEALGQPLEEVFHIVTRRTGEPVESPVTRVLREGVIVGLADDTTLIARDGTKRSIADSGAPMRDREGNIIGTVMVFRDITEKVRAQEALKEKVEEVEKLNWLFVDREGRMINLKREINSLLEKLGQPPKYESPAQVDELRKRFAERIERKPDIPTSD